MTAIGPIDLGASTLYSFATSLYLGSIIVAIPQLTKGALPLQAKKADGTSLGQPHRCDRRSASQSTSPYVLCPPVPI
jgi:5'-nucleotidase/UDP-sugar diphosphatase